jgi:hypothetical protein
MCGCGSTATSGPAGQPTTVYVARPNRGDAQEFADKAVASAYVAALGGGTVTSK